MTLKNIIPELFCCPRCGGELQVNDSGFACTGCAESYILENNLLDFKAEEQLFENNWSGSTSAEGMQQWIGNLLKDGYLFPADLDNIPANLNAKQVEAAFSQIRIAMQEEYYQPVNRVTIDLACGLASLFDKAMNFAKLRGKTVILLDLSRYILEQVRSRLEPLSLGCILIYVVGDARNLPLKSNSVDLLSATALFGNASEGAKVLAGIRRVLKPGGRLLLTDTFSPAESRSLKLRQDILKSDDMASLSGARKMLQQAGFKGLEIISHFEGSAHLEGDLIPLTGEEMTVSLIRATK